MVRKTDRNTSISAHAPAAHVYVCARSKHERPAAFADMLNDPSKTKMR